MKAKTRRLPPWLRIAWREAWNNKRFSWFFIANLALGLTGFIAIDAFKTSIEQELHKGSRGLLGADLVINCQNRMCSDEEKKVFLERGESSRVLSLFSMLSFGSNSKLAQLVVADEVFPFYGTITFKGNDEAPKFKTINEKADVWLFPELAVLLGVKPGDKIKIGESSFAFTQSIEQDSTSSGSSFGFVPRAYIGLKQFEATQLIKPGSRFTESYFIKLSGLSDDELNTYINDLKKKMPASDIRISSHTKSSDNLGRAMQMLSDYLGLLALVALFLAAVGSAYLFRSFIITRTKDIAILVSLGASPFHAKLCYALQLLILGVVATVVAAGLSALTFPLVPILTGDLLPIVVVPSLSLKVISVALATGCLGSLLTGLPLLQSINEIKPVALLNESAQNLPWRFKYALWFIPALALYWLLAITQAKSYVIGNIFVLAMIASITVFSLLGYGLFHLFSLLTNVRMLNLRMALRHLSRQKMSATSCFLALGFGAMLMNAVPQIYQIVEEEVSTPRGLVLPSLFVVDIQDDQLKDLQDLLAARNLNLVHVSPLVRARLLGINQEAMKKGDDEEAFSREDERAQWARTRGQNLTYREKLADSERIIAGRDFEGSFDPNSGGIPEISIEMRYAKRLGVGLGDVLSFDVQGVEVKGKIVNIRRVRWTSFQPNFFVSFQPGVLEEAPKIYLAGVPPIPENDKLELQSDIVAKFPNISLVDVASTITRVLDIVYKMGAIIGIMAAFALFVGISVLFSIANHQAYSRRYDINLLKILGHSFGGIVRMIVIEFSLLGLFASFAGVVMSFVLTQVLAQEVFDTTWDVIWVFPFATVVLITGLSVVTAIIATRGILARKPTL